MIPHPVWTRWFHVLTLSGRPAEPQGRRTAWLAARHVVCPHCTNLDTTSPHCSNRRCDWASCTCGAVIYGGRRHRHPRHGSGADTCHDPVAAA
ncbi:hypothetical protein SAMN04488543_3824 [Friedmanniella luteola]|uniref:Uncharacterized protein n=1 Tax=Friedmanniella luteola TaxID=546871 RepID=A0A1H1ZK87_9ACTN|nr:hypothetical protein [Friedmanniella luteola]SDT33987.1 hypothetical protein SAMN04488543_3824 [Friedmanniella luteola]